MVFDLLLEDGPLFFQSLEYRPNRAPHLFGRSGFEAVAFGSDHIHERLAPTHQRPEFAHFFGRWSPSERLLCSTKPRDEQRINAIGLRPNHRTLTESFDLNRVHNAHRKAGIMDSVFAGRRMTRRTALPGPYFKGRPYRHIR